MSRHSTLLAAIALAALAANAGAQSATQAGAATAAAPAGPDVGQAAPDFTAAWADSAGARGTPVTLASLRGKVVVLAFYPKDRTTGCTGQTTTMHLDDFVNEVWSFSGAPATPTDVVWVKQEAGTDRRCFTQTRLRENVLLQAKVCQSGNGGPAVNVLAGAMQNTLGQ